MKIFIWQGGWQGGAESVTLSIAQFLQDNYDHDLTLGVFKGEKKTSQPFSQVEVGQIFPTKLVAYNTIIASILLSKKLAQYDMVIVHAAGFWKHGETKVVYREPGDLNLLMHNLRWRSKLVYFFPYLVALNLAKRADVIVSASRRADLFFKKLGRTDFVPSTNFIDVETLPDPTEESSSKNFGRVLKLIFVGRADPIKRLDFLIRAIRGIEETLPVELHVLGVEGKSDGAIKYYGWRTEDEVLSFMNNEAQAIVISSRFEASPLVLLKALAVGLPAIVSSSALPIEFADYALSFENEDELADAIRRLYYHYGSHLKNSTQIAEAVRKKYNVEQVLKSEFKLILE